MKKIILMIFFMFLSTTLYADCGACGAKEEKKKVHTHISACQKCEAKKRSMDISHLELSDKKRKTVETIIVKYKKDKEKLKLDYKKSMKKMLTEKQFETLFPN